MVKFVPKLHAKVYVVDRREALICSANLSRSGLDFSFEAGVWTCNPGIVGEVCGFVDKLGGLRAKPITEKLYYIKNH